LGFLPISVLLVTLILNRLLMQREKMERMKKLNIVVGTFFAELGRVKDTLSQRKYFINIRRINLFELRRFLLDHKEFAIDLLDNPAIIEHETFTDLLWNVLHLTDELKRIINFDNLREEEYEDAKNDIETLYQLLIRTMQQRKGNKNRTIEVL